jgi:hypothetical protein
MDWSMLENEFKPYEATEDKIKSLDDIPVGDPDEDDPT